MIINRDPTPYDDLADLVLQGQAGRILSAILERVEEGIKEKERREAL